MFVRYFAPLLAAVTALLILACGDSGKSGTQPIVIDLVEVSPTSFTLVVNQTRQMSVVARAGNTTVSGRAVTWSSSDQNVATVSNSGMVTAKAPGSAQISALVDGITGIALIAVNNPSPTASNIAPASAQAGGNGFVLTVNGSGFVATSVVRWNASVRTTTFISEQQLTAQITAADIATQGTANITVFTPEPGGGTSSQQSFSITETAPTNPAPVLTAINPPTAIQGGTAFTITATGSGFISSSVLRVAGSARTTTFVSATQLSAQITAADIATTGNKAITVFNPTPGGGTSAAINLVVNSAPANPVPAITSIDPVAVALSGGAFTLTVNGTNFVSGSVVRINGTTRATTFVSSTQLTAQMLAADRATAGEKTITVFTPAPGGGTSAAVTLTVVDIGQIEASVSAGLGHVCGIRSDGVASCWGDDSAGQLGNGAAGSSPTAIAVAGGMLFRSISVGTASTCALTPAGVPWCWGANGGRQLGATGGNQPAPQLVTGGHTFSAITASRSAMVTLDFACGLTVAGAAWCWGANLNGTLGSGAATDLPILTPQAVAGGHVFKAVSAGGRHACALNTAGDAWCWGDGAEGALGRGFTSDASRVPVAVSGGNKFTHISSGWKHNCAITAAGATFCWGDNDFEQLGRTGTTANNFTPAQVANAPAFVSISAGFRSTCALTAAGEAYCWGFVNGETIDTPTPAAPGRQFRKLDVGRDVFCGIMLDNSAWCWGYIGAGLLGDGTTQSILTPVPVAGGLTFTQIHASNISPVTCGVAQSGKAYCWGSVSTAANGPAPIFPTPQPVAGTTNFTAISSGFQHACGRTTSGAIYCWGRGYLGIEGVGTQTFVAEPTPISGGGTYTQVSSGDFVTCAIRTGGELRCWGGTNSSFHGETASTIAGGDGTWTAVSASFGRVCGLRTGGVAYCWGSGPVGSGDTSPRAEPTAVAGGHTFSRIATSLSFTCGTVTGGIPYCWGQNGSGPLSAPNSYTPTLVGGGLTFVNLSAGTGHVCAIRNTGLAYCWGDNSYGALGNNSMTNSTTPVAVAGGLVFSQVTAGVKHSCGITTVGAAYCWGDREFGVLGTGQNEFELTLHRVLW